MSINTSTDGEHYAEHEVENYTNEYTSEKYKLEADFIGDSESRQPQLCKGKFPFLRPKQLFDKLIDYYLQHQPQDIKILIKQFNLSVHWSRGWRVSYSYR